METLIKLFEDSDALTKFVNLINDSSALGFYPLLKKLIDDLKSCPQNPDWHAEGGEFEIQKDNYTVIVTGEQLALLDTFPVITKIIKCGTAWDHTLKVMYEMWEQLWYKKDGVMLSNYTPHDRAILMLAALLHDCGKPSAGRMNGKKKPEHLWPSVKGHAEIGAPIAYVFCRKLGLSERDGLQIEWLVRYHMELHDLYEMKDPDNIRQIVTDTNFGFGVLIALADEKGCITTRKNDRPGVIAAFEHPWILSQLMTKLSS